MIEKSSPIPLYFQIKNKIFEDIESGKLKPGERLSAERILAAKYDVTRMTIRQSIRTLVEQGLLDVRPGSGTFVIDRRPRQQNNDTKIIGILVRDIQRRMNIDLIRGIEDQPIYQMAVESFNLIYEPA